LVQTFSAITSKERREIISDTYGGHRDRVSGFENLMSIWHENKIRHDGIRSEGCDTGKMLSQYLTIVSYGPIAARDNLERAD
jgi:hypothetical protein